MSKEPLAELTGKRNVYSMWKEGQATWEEYRDVVKTCRDATRKTETHLELNLARTTRKASSSTSAANGRLEIM